MTASAEYDDDPEAAAEPAVLVLVFVEPVVEELEELDGFEELDVPVEVPVLEELDGPLDSFALATRAAASALAFSISAFAAASAAASAAAICEPY